MTEMPDEPVTAFQEAAIFAASAIKSSPDGGASFMLLLQRELSEATGKPEAYERLLMGLMGALATEVKGAVHHTGIAESAYLAGTTGFVRSTLAEYQIRCREKVTDLRREVSRTPFPPGK